MAKVKKHKLDYRVLSNVTCTCGCGRRIKQNLVDRRPAARLCYFSYLLSKGKTHVFTGTVEVPGSDRRKKIFKPIKPLLDSLRRRTRTPQTS